MFRQWGVPSFIQEENFTLLDQTQKRCVFASTQAWRRWPITMRPTSRLSSSRGPSTTRAPSTALPGAPRVTWSPPAATTRRSSWWTSTRAAPRWRAARTTWRCMTELFEIVVLSRTEAEVLLCCCPPEPGTARCTWRTVTPWRRSRPWRATPATSCRCTPGAGPCLFPGHRTRVSASGTWGHEDVSMLCIRPLLEVLRWPPVVWILQADFLLLVMRMPVLSSMTLEAQGRHLFFFIQMLHNFYSNIYSRSVQQFQVHSSDVRSVRFSPNAYYLLSASYDNNLVRFN